MSFATWYKDNPENPTIFFLQSTSATAVTYDIISFIDFINPNFPMENFFEPFYVVRTNNVGRRGDIVEVNLGIIYHAIVNISINESPIYTSTTVTPFPSPPNAYFYYLSNFEISLSENVEPSTLSKRYVINIPYNYIFPTDITFPIPNAKATIFNFYFTKRFEVDQIPLEGDWTLTRIVLNLNNSSSSEEILQFFIENGIILQLFEEFMSVPTHKILSLTMISSLQTNWDYRFPLNLSEVFPKYIS